MRDLRNRESLNPFFNTFFQKVPIEDIDMFCFFLMIELFGGLTQKYLIDQK